MDRGPYHKMASQYGINRMNHILLNTFVKLLNKSVKPYRSDYDGFHIVNPFCDKGPGILIKNYLKLFHNKGGKV
ncbi:MAG: hypothetical protein Barrevirus14_16 [Barrevirus sp.]|uniref:Uncharacterized protein n=1 Tax=Barrevirus sp. TaxID=2487763 RepID=A0A3G4ZQI8_9VIRU|nr:MAG: hypothetical protein Barrevirus14_16 [Barrevirus sp.]